MPIVNRIAEFHTEIAEFRRDLHQHPELLYDVHRTAGRVADKLKEFGVDEVVTGIGRTGVVGVIRGSGPGPAIGLRADMDALLIEEATGLPYASENDGLMHACGHDGHTSMLLGAAKYLAETRQFNGTAILVFQPAEEGGAGGKAMLEDGLMERFRIEEIYGMHNLPGLPIGQFAIRPGPLLASTDEFRVIVRGRGGHAAWPNETLDPIVAAAAIVGALQSIVARSIDPLDAAVVSVTQIHAGTTSNVIPDTAWFGGTARALQANVRDLLEQRIESIAAGVAASYGLSAEIDYQRKYPVTINHPDETAFAAKIASEIVGPERVDSDTPPILGAEDFSYMLEARPGAFILIGNGDSAGLHSPRFDFNDEAIPLGASYWVRLLESRLAG
ncbi:MAG: M20 aminoacylase family protein [Alphaproteobacteria bacterium]